ncbi:hypothetical protein M231_02585 [Tremella mesenterica]|uniref:AAA+ ATPase domain-containing protein n=1 Tax=Tremella mesenterica TaxID=5217 RepID=A0A4Q1BQC5_TREME|nr:hypothetical protein M231_02585 [Tremella mesenterica]
MPTETTDGSLPDSVQSDVSSNLSTAPSFRSILSFWGNGNTAPPPLPPPQMKKKRKAPVSTLQGKLVTGPDGWTVGKPEVENLPVSEAGSSILVNAPDAEGSSNSRDAAVEAAGREKGIRVITRKPRGKKAQPDGQDVDSSGAFLPIIQTGDDHDPKSSTTCNLDLSDLAQTTSQIAKKKPRKPQTQPSKPTILLSDTPRHTPVIEITSDPPDIESSEREPDSSTFTRPTRRKDGPAQQLEVMRRTLSDSSSSKGALHDPIQIEEDDHCDIEEVKKVPKKLVFASDTRPTHGFFSQVGSVVDKKADLETNGPPEVMEKCHVESPAVEKVKKVHTFFSMNGHGDLPGKLKPGWGGVKEGEEWSVPFPRGDWPSHLHFTEVPSSIDSGLKKRKRNLATASSKDELFWQDFLRQTTTAYSATNDSKPPSSSELSTFPFISNHPAILSLPHKIRSVSNRETWCELYSPRSASEVLGNETEALYLRDWLHTLQLGSSSHSTFPVQRKIRRPKRQNFDGWIVDDVGLFGDPVDSEEEDELQEPHEEPELPLGQRPNSYISMEQRLTNTILLTGPSGSGKSAAVYAAAHELGWEVFEVNPGMGKRTGGNVTSWVGDVGKNHMVVRNEEKKSLKSLLGVKDAKIKEAVLTLETRDMAEESILMDLKNDSKMDVDDETDGREEEREAKKIKQSLILIEEVDILFEEESTFWPSVISLIGESRRPVILTCNDPTMIPLEQLPLQTTLHFQPPPSYLVIPYLEAIAKTSGIVFSTYPSQLYAGSVIRPPDVLRRPLPPNGNEPLSTFDMRRAIMQMQLDRSSSTSQPLSEPMTVLTEEILELKDLTRKMELASFTDTYLDPKDWMILDTIEIDRYSPCADDEIGIFSLLKPEVEDWRPTLACTAFSHCVEISSTVEGLVSGFIPFSEEKLQDDRYLKTISHLLHPVFQIISSSGERSLKYTHPV